MQTMKNNGTLWMIRSLIDKPSFKQHKAALFGDGDDIIDLLNENDVHWVQEHQWCIDGDIYEELRRVQSTPHRNRLNSNPFSSDFDFMRNTSNPMRNVLFSLCWMSCRRTSSRCGSKWISYEM